MATSLSFLDFSRDAKQSFGDYLDQLEKSAAAYRDFTENALVASDKGLDGGLIEQLKQQGPEGALALADFADASEKEIKRANEAFRDTSGLSELEAELSLLPDDIVTQFSTKGAPGAIEQAAEVAAQYNMSPELVETILKAKDYTKADIKAVLARLAELEAADPTVKVDAETDAAKAAIRSLQETLDNLDLFKTVTIQTVKTGANAGTSPGGTGKTRQADGSVLSFYADGGMREKHVAQIAPAGAMRVWAEPETGGEAYIPLADSKRVRSRAIAEQTIGILGGSVQWFANGGIDRKVKLEIKEAEARVRDIQRSLDEKETVKRKGKKERRPVLRGLDEEIAKLQLAEAKKDLRDLKAGRTGIRADAREKAADEAQKAADEAQKAADLAADDAQRIADEAQRAAEEVAARRTSAKESAVSKFGIGTASSAAAVDRNLANLLRDSQTFLGLLGDLKAKGASPWLLAQLVEAGPTKGAIKLAREYATNQTALDSVNAQASQINQYGESYANLVGNAQFSQAGAWNSGISSQSMQTVNINAVDPSAFVVEIDRRVRHALDTMANGGGL